MQRLDIVSMGPHYYTLYQGYSGEVESTSPPPPELALQLRLSVETGVIPYNKIAFSQLGQRALLNEVVEYLGVYAIARGFL